MTEININKVNPELTSIIAKNRKILEKYGAIYGKQIFTVTCENVDKQYNENKAKGLPSLITPIKMYRVKSIDINKIEIAMDASHDAAVILNDNPMLRFALVDPKFKSADTKTVTEAVDAISNNKNPIFFSDRTRLTMEVNALNSKEMQKATDLAKAFTGQTGFLSDLMKSQEIDDRRYLQEIGATDNEETITHHVEIEV